jgi:DNA polymerase III epsilon subunit family exonuclease
MDLHYVAIDVETTGLRPDHDRIVEIGAIRYSPDGVEQGRFSHLCHPGRPIPYQAQLVHRIDDAMVRDRPPVARVVARFLATLTSLGGRDSVILIAHNAPFDIGFLTYEMLRSDLGVFDYGTIDTLPLARHHFPDLADHRLGTVAKYLGLDIGDAHRALADAARAAGIWRAVCCEGRDPNLPLLPLASPAGPGKDIVP